MNGRLKTDAVICADKAYGLATFQTLAGLGTDAMRECRRQGLPVRRVGRRSFVLGADWLRYLEEHAVVVGADGDLGAGR